MSAEYNKLVEVVNLYKYGKSASAFNPFTKELHKHSFLRVVMKSAEVKHIVDKLDSDKMNAVDLLKRIGLVELGVEGEYFIHLHLTELGEIFMNHYVDPTSTNDDDDYD